MEVHHHAHTSGKKWTHYFWEFLMLFLAVFCGFLAEYQLEHKIEHDRAHIYAELLKEDLKKDTAQLNALIKGKNQNEKAKKIQERIWKTPIEKVAWPDIFEPLEFGLDITPFFWNDASYSQMKSSGNLRLLKNKELLQELGTYESTIKNLLGFWEAGKMQLLRSEYIFQEKVNEDKFLLQHPEPDKSISLKEQGFNFTSWVEANTASKELYSCEENLRDIYPKLKKTAETILDLLNKEYNLK